MEDKRCPVFVEGKACDLPLNRVDRKVTTIASYDLTTYECGLGHRFHFLEPSGQTIRVQFEGKKYSGTYSVTSGVVTVESEWGYCQTHAGPKAELTARQVFREILRGAKTRGELHHDMETD